MKVFRIFGLVIFYIIVCSMIGKESLIQDKENVFSIKYPEKFIEYNINQINLKYPSGNGPDVLYGNEDLTVTIGAKLNGQEISPEEIPFFVKSAKEGILKNSNINWISDRIEIINDHKFGVMEMTYPQIDKEIYNLMIATNHNNKLVMVTFNCPKSDINLWEKVFDSSMKSISFE